MTETTEVYHGETALIVAQPAQLVSSLDDAIRVGTIFAKSGLFSDIKSEAQAVVKIIQGQELGVGPMTAMRNIYVLDTKQGLKIEISVGLMAAKFKEAGYDYRAARLDNEGCTLIAYKGSVKLGEASFLKADAVKAGLVDKYNWKAYPSDMYFARALSRIVRRYGAEVLQGNVYVQGEISDAPIDIPGEVLEGEYIESESGNGEQEPTPEPAQAEGFVIPDWFDPEDGEKFDKCADMHIWFGKHKDERLGDFYLDDKPYMHWLTEGGEGNFLPGDDKRKKQLRAAAIWLRSHRKWTEAQIPDNPAPLPEQNEDGSLQD